MGVAVFAALSDGTSITPGQPRQESTPGASEGATQPQPQEAWIEQPTQGSRRVAKIQLRVANARKDFLNKHSTVIANSHGTVVVEALKVRNMSVPRKAP